MANVTKTSVDATSLELLSDYINLNLQRSLTMPGKLLDLSGDVQQGSDTVMVPKFTDLSVVSKLADTELTPQSSTLSVDKLLLNQHKAVPFLMEKIAKIQGMAGFMEQLARNAAIKLAETMDDFVISTLDAGATAKSLATLATVAKEDLIAVKKEFEIANAPREGRYVGFSPKHEAQILAIAEFMEADKYGSSNIPQGIVGRAFGLNIVVSNGFADDAMYAWHEDSAAVAVQLSPDVNVDYSPLHLGDIWTIDTIYGAKVLRSSTLFKYT